MSNSIKISADTSEAKKGILDFAKGLKDIKSSGINILSQDDKKFMKNEMKKEMGLIRDKIKANAEELKKAIKLQKSMVKDTKEELELRKEIIESYKTQAQLAKEHGKISQAMGKKVGAETAEAGMSMISKLPMLLAAMTVGFAIIKTVQATQQYRASTGGRNRLKGLGVGEDDFGSPEELARVGLTNEEMIDRRIQAESALGRDGGTSNSIEMKKAGFERAFGLEGGTMTQVAAQMAPQLGGKSASDTQMKLQASIFAAGIKDRIGPYLEASVNLLTKINADGMGNTSDIIALMSQLTADKERTPEMIASAFSTIDQSIKGATGEQSSFIQTAFARKGIGGGTLGGTRFAMESGGLLGLDRGELEKRGYNKDLLSSLEQSGIVSSGGKGGTGDRAGALLDQFKTAAGGAGSISGIKDPDKMFGLNNLANKMFGTKGNQGFDALMMLEKVQKKQMTQKEFQGKLKQMQESSPETDRLDLINKTLSGQTELLQKINSNIMMGFGIKTAPTANELQKTENQAINGLSSGMGAVNDTGLLTNANARMRDTLDHTFSVNPKPREDFLDKTFLSAIAAIFGESVATSLRKSAGFDVPAKQDIKVKVLPGNPNGKITK